MRRLRLSSVSLCRAIMYLAVGLAVCELLVVNLTILYVYNSISSKLSLLFAEKSVNDHATFLDKLLKLPAVKSLVYEGKSGGFAKLLQNSVERVFVVTDNVNNSVVSQSQAAKFGGQQVSLLGLDVSSAGEVLFLVRRIQARGGGFFKTYSRLVIDIGANDGLMASNSFNLIQLGWDAILVEPQSSLVQQAIQNLARYIDPYNEGNQRVVVVNALLSNQDGMADFVLMDDDQESHMLDNNRANREGRFDPTNKLIVKVPSLTVGTFAQKYNVPKKFAILSIDAEGVGDKVLHQWIDGGFRPAYIVYEQLHNREPIAVTNSYLKNKGYHYLIRLGWNYIYEHLDS